jgi:hypothetical protein
MKQRNEMIMMDLDYFFIILEKLSDLSGSGEKESDIEKEVQRQTEIQR